MTVKTAIIKILSNKRLMKYFVMAVIIVGIELIVFQLLYIATKNYLFATSLSFITGVALNWIFGRKFVFGASSHHALREFIMVLIASVFGLLIQLCVVSASVQVFHFYPLVGKVLSIMFSFFWNYWFRARFIYKNSH